MRASAESKTEANGESNTATASPYKVGKDEAFKAASDVAAAKEASRMCIDLKAAEARADELSQRLAEAEQRAADADRRALEFEEMYRVGENTIAATKAELSITKASAASSAAAMRMRVTEAEVRSRFLSKR